MDVKYTKPQELEPHSLNIDLVPEMSPQEFEALKEDIAEKGIRQPLEVLKGTNLVLDGRNRWRAAVELGVEVPYVEVDIPEEEVSLYVLERVPTHRSLTPGVRAALAAEWVEATQKFFKTDERRIYNLKQFSRSAKNCTSEDNPESENFHCRSVKIDTSEIGSPKLQPVGKLRKLAAQRFGFPEKGAKNCTFFPEPSESYGGAKNGTTIKIGKLRDLAAKNTGVALSGRTLLKRTHHGGEEADHSQTHDPRGTQSLPQKARAFAEGSCGAFGCFSFHHSSLGNRSKSNSVLSSFHFGLFRKRNPALAPFLSSLTHYHSVLDFAYLISYLLI